nr:auxilin-like protein [Tanacetum cinerariifolium]
MPGSLPSEPPPVVDVDSVLGCIQSFPKGTSCGRDGLRTQHILDALCGEGSAIAVGLLKAISVVVNLLLEGRCLKVLAEFMASAPLTPLLKSDNEIRPIAFGLGVPSGAEAMLHSMNRFLNKFHSDGSLAMLTVDFSNAFNLVDRTTLLHEVRTRCTSISLWMDSLYRQSARDYCQLLFHAWYLDDGTIVGDTKEDGLFPRDIGRLTLGVKLLGDAVSVDAGFISSLAVKRAFRPVELTSHLPSLRDPQSELLLHCSCMGVAKLLFGLRTCQPMHIGEAVSIFDNGLRRAIEAIVVCESPFFGDFHWSLASLSIRTTYFKDVVLMGLILTIDMRWIVELVKSLGVSFNLSPSQKAVVKCLRALCARIFLTVMPIEGLGQHMSALEYRTILKYWLMIPLFSVDEPCPVCRKVCLDSLGEHAVHCKELPGFKYRHDLVRDFLCDVLKRARISSKKEVLVNFLTDLLEGRSTLRPTDILVFGWAGGKHDCVDLTEVSPLVGLKDNEFVTGQAALKAESSNIAKHEKACLENQYVFIPFAFDTFCFLAPEADEFLTKVQRVIKKLDMKNDMKARGTLLMALLNKDQLKFHSYKDSKLLIEAIEKSINNTSSTNEADHTAYAVSTAHSQVSPTPQLAREDLEQIDPNDLEEMDLHWEIAMLTIRVRRKVVPMENPIKNALIAQDEIRGYEWSYQAEEEHPTNYALMELTSSESSFSSDSELVEERLAHYTKNEAVFEEKINIFNLKVKLRDNALVENIKKLEKTENERDELKLTLDKFQNSSKSLNNLLESQVSNRVKTRLGYKAASPAVESFVNSSEMLENQENVKSRSDKGYHAIPPPYAGNYIPPKPDLMHMIGNKCYLTEYEDYDGGFVSFGDGKGRISGKGKIKTETLDLDVYFCKELKYNLFRIKREFNVARTPQQNVNTACYVLNRALVIKPHNKTPYELIRGRPPLIDFMKPFGYPVTILNTRDYQGKFDKKLMRDFFVGYFVVSKAMSVFNKRARIVEETLNIRFLENAPNVKGNGPDWLFDIDSLTISINYEPVVIEKQTNGIAGTKYNIVAGQAKKKKELEQEYTLIPICTTNPLISQGPKDSAVDVAKKATKVNESRVLDNGGQDDQVTRRIFGNAYDDEAVEEEVDMNNVFSSYTIPDAPLTKFLKDHPKDQMEPKKLVQALKDPSWVEAMRDEFLQFKLLNVWTLVDLPKDKWEIASTPMEPNITFAVCACERFQVTPKTSHLYAVKRIFRYLKGQPKLSLWYPRDSPFDLEAYSDSDYAGASFDRKSTAGVFNSKTKHIEIRHQFIKDSYEKKLIQVIKIHTDYNVTDLLTNAFDEDKMERAATIASSLEVKQDNEAQTRFEAASKQSNDPYLLKVHTLGSGEDIIKLEELMEFCIKLSE